MVPFEWRVMKQGRLRWRRAILFQALGEIFKVSKMKPDMEMMNFIQQVNYLIVTALRLLCRHMYHVFVVRTSFCPQTIPPAALVRAIGTCTDTFTFTFFVSCRFHFGPTNFMLNVVDVKKPSLLVTAFLYLFYSHVVYISFRRIWPPTIIFGLFPLCNICIPLTS